MHISSQKLIFIRGALILTAVSFCTRSIGFFYRIFLSRTFGAEGVGLYHLIFPVYALCISLSCAGIEIALSRIVARYIALKNPLQAKAALKTAIFCSILISLFCTVALQFLSPQIAVHFLNEDRCVILLKVMSYALPFASVHACICGYCLGLKQTHIPGISQLLEQGVRVLGTWFLYLYVSHNSKTTGILVAVCGLVLGEIAACFYSIFSTRKLLYVVPSSKISSFSLYKNCFSELLAHAAPLTANRITLNILQSIEVVSIPKVLVVFGLSQKSALSHYGILNGIAMPCIFFPCAITNAVSMMMLPTVAEIQAARQDQKLEHFIQKISGCCIFLGCICTIGFLIFADFLGNTVFQSPDACRYIRTLAFMCPFLYTNSTYISVLNGLGKTTSTFCINIIGLSIRIAGVFFLIPHYGMFGYLIGLLSSQILIFFLCIRKLHKTL